MQPQLFTFLFTDLEGSTRRWEAHPEAMEGVMSLHDALLLTAVQDSGGAVVKTTGDGIHAVFSSPERAIRAAAAGQAAILAQKWPAEIGPVMVRMGLHTGESQARDGDYYGTTLNKAARIMAAGHGGQILFSGATFSLVSDRLPDGLTVLDLGEHSLRDLAQPVRVHQLCYPGMPAQFPPLKSLSVFKHNLPPQLTSFIGREKEMALVRQKLAQTSLLTLLGPGGTGKTRLMLQVAADLLEEFPDGVWLVELAPLSDPDLIIDQAAGVFGVTQQTGRPLLDTLSDFLKRKKALLLIDNVEHVVTESAAFVETLLHRTPDIKILVTGRESLFIEGETTVQIPSLQLPAGAGEGRRDPAERSEAVQLFLERVSAVRPNFVLTKENSPAVIEIVRRLDGIPLALELAAARARSMSIEQIAERLNDRFRLLTGGRRTALPRQQTLQALIEWSWNLLDEAEKTLLARLSVFSGGWTLEAAEAVAGYDGLDVFDGMDMLVGKSLVIADFIEGGDLRYRMLESIHQFARDRLFETGATLDLRSRHLEYVMDLIRQVQPMMRGKDMLKWQTRISTEIDNFRAARDWSIELGPEKALELVGCIDMTVRFWLGFPESKRWWQEVHAISRSYLEGTDDPKVKVNLATLLIHLGSVTFLLGDHSKGYELLQPGIDMARELGEERIVVYGLGTAVLARIFAGDLEMAMSMSQEAIAISRRINSDMEMGLALGSIAPSIAFGGDRAYAIKAAIEAAQVAQRSGNPWMQAMAEHQLARIELARERWREAVGHFSKAVEMFHVVRDKALEIICRSDQAHLLRRLGDLDAAEQTYRQTIDFFYDGRHLSAVAHQLESFGYVAIGRNQFERAAVLLGAAAGLRSESGMTMTLPPEIAEYEQALETLEHALGERVLEEAQHRGRLMTTEAAIDYAKEGHK